jgi:hypothetical protein
MAQSVHVLSNHNQYKGINAHLQSRLQETNGGWSSFHDQHIHEIARALNRILPPNYYASTEDSMQIKTRTEPDGLVLKRQPDTSVLPPRFDTTSDRDSSAARFFAGMLEVEQEQYQKAVVLYKRTDDDDIAITRIEVLSPANIGSRVESAAYDRKRDETLTAGINLIEVHYLHRSPPPTGLKGYVPNYAVSKYQERSPEATAYYVSVTEPLGLEESDDVPGKYRVPLNIRVYPFGVEDPLPTVSVPLAEGDDPVLLNMQVIYDSHFFEQRWGIGVYYDQTPEHLDSYSLKDQFFINARSITTVDAYQTGVSLESGQKLNIDFDHINEIARRIADVRQSDATASPSEPEP